MSMKPETHRDEWADAYGDYPTHEEKAAQIEDAARKDGYEVGPYSDIAYTLAEN